MSSMVREHRQKLRKKYGVQFLLDALRTHYRLGWRALADVGGPAQQRLVWGQDDVLPQLTCLFPHPTPPHPDFTSPTRWLCLSDLPARSASAP